MLALRTNDYAELRDGGERPLCGMKRAVCSLQSYDKKRVLLQ